jgi:hypothetical protein
MADWATISSLATAGGTLVLAFATYASVRSANRAARTAEWALQVGMRPLLTPSRLEDPPERMMWGDQHWAEVQGGRAYVEIVDDRIYLAMSLRNAGSGIAVIQGWHIVMERLSPERHHSEPEDFTSQMRDLYVPAGDVGFWQTGLRDPNDPIHEHVRQAIEEPRLFSVELLYTDHEGGQRTVSWFSIAPREDETQWLASVVRHWNLDRPDPR